MKKLILLALIVLNAQFAFAQKMDESYAFTTGSGALLQNMIGGDTLIGPNVDDSPSASIELPGTFYFNGQGYDAFKVTPNGVVELGKVTSNFRIEGPMQSFDQLPTLQPYLIDAHTKSTGLVMGYFDFNTNIYTVDWMTAIPYTASVPNSNFQLQLDFNDYSIKFQYGTCANGPKGAVGIMEDNTFFSSVNPVSNIANSDSILAVSTTAPVSGTFYLWTPTTNPAAMRTVGIGTGSPTSNLDIKGRIRIRGGNPGLNKVLTSDNQGNALWQALPVELPTTGNQNSTLRFDGTNWVATSALSIDASDLTSINNGLKITTGAAANRVLTSDASGNATWQNLPAAPLPIAFNVRLDSNRVLTSSYKRLHFGNYGPSYGNFNQGNAYNTATDEFVAPSTGIYAFSINTRVLVLSTNFSFSTFVQVLNASNIVAQELEFTDIVGTIAATYSNTFTHSFTLYLNAGDKLNIQCRQLSTGTTSSVFYGLGGVSTTNFSGHRVN